MAEIKLYLWSSDGYDCVNWDMEAEISIEDYSKLVDLLKQYQHECLMDSEEEHLEFELLNSKEFTEDYLSKTTFDIHCKLEKQANAVIKKSFEEAQNSEILDIDVDDYNYGYWIHYDWMNSVTDIES